MHSLLTDAPGIILSKNLSKVQPLTKPGQNAGMEDQKLSQGSHLEITAAEAAEGSLAAGEYSGNLSGSLSPISVVRSEIELLTAVGLKSQLAAATYRTCCDVSNDPVRLLSVRDRFIPP